MQREKLDLRDYQLDGLDRFSRWYATVNDMEALIALTMGMGKPTVGTIIRNSSKSLAIGILFLADTIGYQSANIT
jgi:superfamily II DNA or RNA helicase